MLFLPECCAFIGLNSAEASRHAHYARHRKLLECTHRQWPKHSLWMAR